MALHSTAGQLAVNSILPEELRDYSRVLDKKGIEKLMQQVAEKRPDSYRQIAHDLSSLGHRTAYFTGGNSFGLEHLRQSLAGKQAQMALSQKIRSIYVDPKLSEREKELRVVETLLGANKKLEEDNYNESLAEHNPLALQVLSGSRGNKTNLRSLRAGDLLYVDHRDNPIPVPILSSYSQGLTPVEYYAGTFGARKGVVDTKFCLDAATQLLGGDYSAVRLADVQVGDWVMGSDRQGRLRPVRVTAVYDNGVRPCYRYRFRKGQCRDAWVELTATEDHKVLAEIRGGRNARRSVYEPTPLPLKLVGKKKLELKQALLHLSEDTSSRELGLKFHDREFVGDLPTRDIEVDHPDHLFVLANGIVTSNSTQDAGALSKQLNQIVHRLVVVAHDSDREPDAPIGLPVDAADPDNEGSLLARPTMGYPRNTVLTTKILADLRDKGVKSMLVRSPIVGGHPTGGLLARDLGVRERGGLPPVGDNVGIAAAQSLSEPLAQSQLSSKHSGGVAGASKGVAGFKLVNQLVQVPKSFRGGATHAQEDGRVQSVQPAPQGGSYVTIGGVKHYVGPDHEVQVRPGDEVEAGDQISDGITNPAEVVKHKHVGEGKRYFVDAFRKAYADSGIVAHRRNIEILARGLIDHVRATDNFGDFMPGDIAPYAAVEHAYKPREGHEILPPKRAAGMYLEAPVLHYSIGTRVKPSVVKRLAEFSVPNVVAHKDPPPFEPVMIRGMESLSHDHDWMTRFLGSYLERNLLKGVQRGDSSDESGTSYVPILARGVDFGRKGLTKGWRTGSILHDGNP